MNPYYFGRSDTPLFGIYQPPRSKPAAAVVLCYPIGHEYLRSHRSFKQLSDFLSKAGFHVFRFDYQGTGDSAGGNAEWDLNQWTSDINTAIDELKDTSGANKVSLVGLRLGGSLAAAVCSRRNDIRQLILWDPVIRGRRYLNELVTMHRSMLSDLNRFPVARVEATDSDELLGFTFAPKLRAAIRQIDLLQTAPSLRADKIYLMMSEDRDDYIQLRDQLDQLRGAQTRLDSRTMLGTGEWDRLDKLEVALLPYEVLRAITTVLAGD